MDFIFMFTRNDQTVEDCLDVFELIKPLKIKHLGFKDVGVDIATLKELNRRIKETGATSYLEVVSTSTAEALKSAKAAVEIGIDRLMGGTQVEEILNIIKNTKIKYFPFPGRPEGHPTKLGGTPDSVADDCRRFSKMGCAGVDLLAYRATEADPIELVKAARKALDGYLVVAGSVTNPGRIRDLKKAGADAFTIGSAIFDGSFSPRKGHILSQFRDVLDSIDRD